MGRRGYAPEDEKQFTGRQLELLQKAADEVQFLLDQGYDVKPVTTFVGNHYLFSERQRLAGRSISEMLYISTIFSLQKCWLGKSNASDFAGNEGEYKNGQ